MCVGSICEAWKTADIITQFSAICKGIGKKAERKCTLMTNKNPPQLEVNTKASDFRVHINFATDFVSGNIYNKYKSLYRIKILLGLCTQIMIHGKMKFLNLIRLGFGHTDGNIRELGEFTFLCTCKR